MGRSFSLSDTVRRIAVPLLREFLNRLGQEPLSVDWSVYQPHHPMPVVDAIFARPVEEFNRVEAAFQAAHDLGCKSGAAALAEAADLYPEMQYSTRLPQDYGLTERAVWSLIHVPEIAAMAGLIHRVETLSWWRRRDDLPLRKPETSPRALQRFAAGLSELLVTIQGRGRVCTVETMTRRGTEYFFAYPDDYVETVTAHHPERQLGAQMLRRTFPIVLAFEPTTGSLELFAKVSPQVKLAIEQTFARCLLGHDLGEYTPQATYALDRLHDLRFDLTTDPEDAVAVEIRQVRLSFQANHRQILLTADPDRPRDMKTMLAEVLDQEHVPWSAVHISLVKFCFHFASLPGRKASSLTFEVAFPHHCSLRNQQADRVALVEKYLARWGVLVNGTGPNLAAAG
ncbi:MAG: hypothetical protein LC104_09600 [Bacteroidales bacterium]|nr:hypothetical protein [Bacteroidales bacterium]